jgi:two-component system OmpR family sensor kinase
MPDPVWYRSLYFRIAAGFVGLLGALLVVQGFVFLWMTGRMTELFPSRSPAQFAVALASDITAALDEKPDSDVGAHVAEHDARTYRGFAIAMDDGRVYTSIRIPAPPNAARAALGRLAAERSAAGLTMPWAGGRGPDGGRGRDFRGGPGPDAGKPPDFGRGGDRPPDFGRGGGPGRGGPGFGRGGGPPLDFAAIIVAGEPRGMVAVSSEPPPLSIALRDLGPTLAIVAFGLLIAGTAVGALVVVRPVHRRLSNLQEAARALGEGDTSARARESGRDEVAALARTFNERAGQLEERTRALENADRTRRQLLADVSHELSTPLAAIKGYIETLAMTDLPLDEPTRTRYLGIVTEEAERLDHIIGDLLDLAKLEGGGAALRMDQVSIQYLLERISHRHERVVRERGIALDIVQEAGAELVFGDPNRLEQALQNLVANAVRHTPDGGRVSVRASATDDSILFSVEDTGPGIPAEHLPHIFDRFYKVDQARTGTVIPSGSGLGLSIVQAIVLRHGGRVSAANPEGGGARFEIVLPSAG